MPDSTYPLALPPAGTDVHSMPIERVNQAILFSQLRTAELIAPTGTLIDVTLVPNLADGGWRVRWGYGTIGALPAGIRSIFSDIDRVNAIHSQPETKARVWMDKEVGLLRVAVELPAPELVMPLTSAPDGTLILPQGELIKIDADLPKGQYLVFLRAIENHVELLIDGQVIAVLTGSDVALVRARLFGIDLPGARVFSLGDQGEQVVLDVGPGSAIAVPALPAPLQPPESKPVPEPASVITSDSWAVTMSGEQLAEPAPSGTRPISLPKADLS
ncbi:hypothetical protein [Corynebacterium alimapuense]|uniref:Uncharacterized protein n=1 Tax=Corynebacterium alimapuense TaxID=1576874 RepID=A0A3M8K5L1_9CORY|nr:hypothetical protein [Corynebacterium alimapuense]RNE48491.1 hypothetical protein C5L39_08305 [Corynebacterium alimapuense]